MRNPTVLVVDDNPMLRTLLATVLRREGFQVLLAADGQEAVELYQRIGSTIDVVLADVQMDRLDGPQALAAIHQIDPLVRWVFMSGDPDEYTIAELLNLGAAAFLEKPFADLGAVARTLRQAISTRLAA